MANYYSDEDVYVNRGTFIPVNEDARELMFGIEPRPGTLYERRRHPKRAAPAPRDVQKQNRNNTFSWNLLLFLVFLGLGVSYLYKSAQSDLAPGSSFGVSFNNLWDDSRPSDSVEVAYEEESEQPGEDPEAEADVPGFTVDDPYRLADLLNVSPEINEVLRLRTSMLGLYERTIKKGNKAAQQLHDILAKAKALRPEPFRRSRDGRRPIESIFEQDIIHIDDQMANLHRHAEGLWTSATQKTEEARDALADISVPDGHAPTTQQRADQGGRISVCLAELGSAQSTEAESLINEIAKFRLFTTAAINHLTWLAHPSGAAGARDTSEAKVKHTLGYTRYWHSQLTRYRHLFPPKEVGQDDADFESVTAALGGYYNALREGARMLRNLHRTLGTLKAKADAVRDYAGGAGRDFMSLEHDLARAVELYVTGWKSSTAQIENQDIGRREEGLLWHYFLREEGNARGA